ncbi:hypothetical protein B0T20DRAFT_476691 [Sordaria brevicollis]|uniref:Uncharacterized protein n=1 Tax=Sordaria brevicollis TaxID=83679 RepID=A0AAE0PIU1_SORBR|nr:hypothetical protein B0T20DRAFT_476691 [Sordaria brevicollis]
MPEFWFARRFSNEVAHYSPGVIPPRRMGDVWITRHTYETLTPTPNNYNAIPPRREPESSRHPILLKLRKILRGKLVLAILRTCFFLSITMAGVQAWRFLATRSATSEL